MRAAGPDLPSGGVIVDDGLAEAYEDRTGQRSGPGDRRRSSTLTGPRQVSSSPLPPTWSAETGGGAHPEADAQRAALVTDVRTRRSPHRTAAHRDRAASGASAQAVLTELYRLACPWRNTFGINNVVLVGGTPPDARPCDLAPKGSTTGSTSCAAAQFRLEGPPATAPGRRPAHLARRHRPGRVDHPQLRDAAEAGTG